MLDRIHYKNAGRASKAINIGALTYLTRPVNDRAGVLTQLSPKTEPALMGLLEKNSRHVWHTLHIH